MQNTGVGKNLNSYMVWVSERKYPEQTKGTEDLATQIRSHQRLKEKEGGTVGKGRASVPLRA